MPLREQASPARTFSAVNSTRYRGRSSSVLLGLLLTLLITGCNRGSSETSDAGVETLPFDVTSEPVDSVIFEERIEWARAQRLDTLSLGDAMVALGRTFVGAPYKPQTLELAGPERLIVNLRELDCVTFVESTLALVRTLRSPTVTYRTFQRELALIRYRDGVLNGYPSRLHYFSEWIANNHAKGVVEDVTASLGGHVDAEPLRFMTQHRASYRQLADTATFAEIGRMEASLVGRVRYYIPEDDIETAAPRIRNGDVIAATSTLAGLDVAHTGIAVWEQGQLHLMHAPLVGSVVEISNVSLAERIKGIPAQDGIMVARPRM